MDVPAGTVRFYNTLYADNLVVRNGDLELNGEAVDDAGPLNVNVQAGRLYINGGDMQNTSITLASGTFCRIYGGYNVKDLAINNGNYVDNTSGVRIDNGGTTVLGTLSGTGQWGQNQIQVGAGGTLAPGDGGVGTLNKGGNKNLNMLSDSIYDWEISDPDAPAGIGSDMVWAYNVNLNNGTLLVNLLDLGVGRDIDPAEKFALFGATNACQNYAGVNLLLNLPDGWSGTGSLVYDETRDVDSDGQADKALFLTGLTLTVGTPGDVNGDDIVDAADYILMKQNWGNASSSSADAAACDLDTSGTVDAGDMALLATALNNATIGAVTPEPATLALLALGGLAVIRRRRK